MKEYKEFIYVMGGGILGALIASIYYSPYNQCVRAQEFMNKNNKNFVYNFPSQQARVQCAEAFGGKPD